MHRLELLLLLLLPGGKRLNGAALLSAVALVLLLVCNAEQAPMTSLSTVVSAVVNSATLDVGTLLLLMLISLMLRVAAA